jgi:peptidoglycan/xylan/chitin deacetylase (PgdA/CDA1 family)
MTAGERDLVGYGGRWPDVTWPGGSRLAVSVVVNFEEGAELQVGDGDPVSEHVGEVVSVVAPGVRDQGQEQVFGYGMRAGLWRTLDALDDRGVTATFFACGRAVERVPALAREVADRGHEIALHGWRWRPQADYADAATEAQDLDRAAAVIEQATGRAPRGFFCRGGESPWTRDLLRERGYRYTSNAFDDDLPYWEDHRDPLLVVPYSLDSNDMKFFHPNGFVRSAELVEYVRDGLDVLLREAASGRPRLMNLGFHLRITGRPGRFPALTGVLDLLAERRDDLFVGTRDQIATAFAAAHPAGSR